MSFLAPLYLLGALAVSLPVVLHMIRRTPRDRREFSSTMFLQPSPPKITRRSRIEHWLLLLLRGLAVGLLALAFARPFFRESEQRSLDNSDGQALVILVDISASMRREGLWDEAQKRLEELLYDEVTAADRVAVLAFDETLRPLCDFPQWDALEPPQRPEAVMAALAEVTPTWRATDLGAALIEAAERLDALDARDGALPARRVVLVSDLQSGSNLELLQSYDWPKTIVVDLRPVGGDASANNAGLHVVADAPDAPHDQQQRVQVVNSPGADRDEFAIRWDNAITPAADSDKTRGAPTAHAGEVSVIVPAGQGRIVRSAPRPSEPVDRLVLAGDDHPFDNVSYLPPSRPRHARVAVLGAGSPDDPQEMEFYLPAAFSSLPQRQIEVIDWNDRGEASAPPELVTVTAAPPPSDLAALKAYVKAGGTILWAAPDAPALESVFSLLDAPAVRIAEAGEQEYAMLSQIDFGHPLFAALRDPRFSDFTKVRFWKHRVLPDGAIPDGRVVASFDNGDAAVVEVPLGSGRIILLTSGWQPEDSQLAVSTKFVPMLNSLVDDVAGFVERRTTYYVGEAVPLAPFDPSAVGIVSVHPPEGPAVSITDAAMTFDETDVPGIYTVQLEKERGDRGDPLSFAVNLDPAESRTARMTDENLTAAGVQLRTEQVVHRIDAAAQRQLRAGELENRQKLWRWVVIAVIALLILETLLASRAARRQLAST